MRIKKGELPENYGKTAEEIQEEKVRARALMNPEERQLDEVQEIMKKYTTMDMSKKEKAIKERDDRIALLRERYEELKHSHIGDGAMNSYDRYMNVQGMRKKK